MQATKFLFDVIDDVFRANDDQDTVGNRKEPILLKKLDQGDCFRASINHGKE